MKRRPPVGAFGYWKAKIDDGLTSAERYQQRHLAAGLCRYCSNPALPGIQTCETCRERINKVGRDRYQKKKRVSK